jgi:hypothetical protein
MASQSQTLLASSSFFPLLWENPFAHNDIPKTFSDNKQLQKMGSLVKGEQMNL